MKNPPGDDKSKCKSGEKLEMMPLNDAGITKIFIKEHIDIMPAIISPMS